MHREAKLAMLAAPTIPLPKYPNCQASFLHSYLSVLSLALLYYLLVQTRC